MTFNFEYDLVDILGKERYVENVGHISPVKILSYNQLNFFSGVLFLSEERIREDIQYKIEDETIKALDVICSNEELLNMLFGLLKTLFADVKLNDIEIVANENDYEIIVGDKIKINRDTFEEFRKTVLLQNCIVEPPIFKNQIFKNHFEKALKMRNKQSQIGMIDKVSVISILGNKTYEYISNMTIFQVEYEYMRICKIEEFRRAGNLLGNGYADLSKVEFDHFSEKINMSFDILASVFKDTKESNLMKAQKAMDK